jgi:hypothetical protein
MALLAMQCLQLKYEEIYEHFLMQDTKELRNLFLLEIAPGLQTDKAIGKLTEKLGKTLEAYANPSDLVETLIIFRKWSERITNNYTNMRLLHRIISLSASTSAEAPENLAADEPPAAAPQALVNAEEQTTEQNPARIHLAKFEAIGNELRQDAEECYFLERVDDKPFPGGIWLRLGYCNDSDSNNRETFLQGYTDGGFSSPSGREDSFTLKVSHHGIMRVTGAVVNIIQEQDEAPGDTSFTLYIEKIQAWPGDRLVPMQDTQRDDDKWQAIRRSCFQLSPRLAALMHAGFWQVFAKNTRNTVQWKEIRLK